MRRTAKLGSALIAAAAIGALAWWQWGKPVSDDYDYTAAFEAQAPGSTAPLLNIVEVVGKTSDELRALLGPPESCETTQYSSRCSYARGSTEVVFIEGKADWITVNALDDTPFSPAALSRIGLTESKPQQQTESELIWTGLVGLREVRVVGDGEHVEFIRIKAKS